MQLELHCTTLAAAARWFKVSRLGRTMNRGMKSGAEGNSVNSRSNFRDKEQGQPQLLNDEEFPSLSAVRSKKGRRTRSDLHTLSKPNSEEIQRIGPSQFESNQNDTYLPASFGKNPSSSATNPDLNETYNEHGTFDTETSEFNFSHKLHQTSHKNREAKRSSVSEPFDTETREFNPIKNGKNRSSSHRNPKFRQTYHEHKEARTSSRFSHDTSVDEPFDICLPGMIDPVEEIGQVLRPGMVLLRHYIPLFQQVDIVNRCRELGCGPGGFYRPGYEDGAKLRLYMMCLGLDWNPQTKRYGKKRHHDNATPPDIPQEFTSLVCRALDDSHTLIRRDLKITNVEDELPAMSPDVCIVNFYNTNGRLGLHQDRDESKESLVKGLPVVSISIGDSAEFLYGDERDAEKAESVLLESGDVLIFGGESRHIFHGVKTIIRDSAPNALLRSTRLRPGRLNLTFRKY